LDPDPDSRWVCGSGSRKAKMMHRKSSRSGTFIKREEKKFVNEERKIFFVS
jgi:hypothetical protein